MNTALALTTRMLTIDAVLIADECSCEEDLEVEGRYQVEVPADLPDTKAASVALDHFHAEIAVNCLDDFAFRVIDEEGKALEEDEDHESYSGLDIPATVYC